jgi:MFS family permease
MRLMSTRAITGTAFAATMALSGFLLFQIQPILAKFILPWFGGSASTWLACALFFQLALLTGYALAFVLTRARHAVQTAIVAVALSLCLFLLPIAPADSWRPSGSGDPTLQVLGLLLACVGLPFVVLAMTTPLLSLWLANAAVGLAPLRFFVASNVGSFLGPLTYPFLIEHVLTSRAQAGAWSWMFIVYAGLCVLCAALAARSGSGAGMEPQIPRQATPREPVLAWVALAMLGSALMLATSNAMMQWSAVVPFLWVLPLSIYLLSFVVVFADRAAYSRPACGIPFLVLAISTPWLLPLPETTMGLLVRIAHHGATLFFGCMICHGELVARRPPTIAFRNSIWRWPAAVRLEA